MNGYFITGTSTGVGKTVVSALIARFLHTKKRDLFYYKPIETGVPAEAPYGEDVRYLLEQAPFLKKEGPQRYQNYSFQLAASPHLAATQEKRTISKQTIISHAKKLQRDFSTLLCEGAGGLMVPVDESYLMIELIQELAFSSIIVATAGLGTINHTLLTVEALRSRNIPITGVVVNRFPDDPSIIEQDNIRIIQKISKLPILAVIPETTQPSKLDPTQLFSAWQDV